MLNLNNINHELKIFNQSIINTHQHSSRKNIIISSAESYKQIKSSEKVGNNDSFPCSPLILRKSDLNYLIECGKKLNHAIETVADCIYHDQKLIQQQYPEYAKYYPYLQKNNRWQQYSRYDFIINKNGEIKFIELNTCCPAGIMLAENINNNSKETYKSLFKSDAIFQALPVDNSENFVNHLCKIEKESGIKPGLIAILYDENHVTLELNELKSIFVKHGRDAVVANASDLKYHDGHLYYQGSRISLTYNKFRVTGHTGDYWRKGFEHRYSDFLQAIKNRSICSVNNFMGMVFLEDKKTLEFLSTPNTIENLKIDPNTLKLLPWTVKANTDTAIYKDKQYNLLSLISQRKNEFVLKASGLGRGADVFIGIDHEANEWINIINSVDLDRFVVQEYIPSSKFDILSLDNGIIDITSLYQTGAIYFINGEFYGIISRISSDIVSNVGKVGMMQAVLVKETP